MRLLGTIDEWLAHKPKACLRNDRITVPEGMYLFNVERLSEPRTCTFPTGRANGTEPLLYVGPGPICPYMERGTFNYAAGQSNWHYGAASGAVLSDKQANDPNWYEVHPH